MRMPSPQIGFDRFIDLEWVTAALRIRAGLAAVQELDGILEHSHAGLAARKKTRTVLNRLWLEPREELVDFANRGIELFCADSESIVPALSWGMALATYPFFGRVAEIVGRLTALQGDCASAEVHRRMSEIYGEREGTRRMTNMVLQSQASWGGAARKDGGRRIVRKQTFSLQGAPISAWLTEACLRYTGRTIAVASIATSPVLYPFNLDGATAYWLSKSRWIEVRTDGAGSQIVGLISL